MTSDFTLLLMMLGVGIVAFLYSSVGHGGASGYLAILSLFSLMPRQMGTTALLLNCLVSGVAFITFFRAGHFSSRLTWPFLVASMPFAWIGGALSVSPPFYKMLLAFTLLVAAVRLSLQMSIKKVATYPHHPSLAIALPMGGGIGLLSGMVGVGGGIFLTPLLLLKGWADPKSASASSATAAPGGGKATCQLVSRSSARPRSLILSATTIFMGVSSLVSFQLFVVFLQVPKHKCTASAH